MYRLYALVSMAAAPAELRHTDPDLYCKRMSAKILKEGIHEVVVKNVLVCQIVLQRFFAKVTTVPEKIGLDFYSFLLFLSDFSLGCFQLLLST